MKAGLAKKLPLLLAGAIALAGSGGAVYADGTNRPYIKTYGADVMTGGWYDSGNNCATGTGSNYQDPNFSSSSFPADARAGGILTYTKTSGTDAGGDSSQYGAISVGEVDGRSSGYGFYSDGAQSAGGGPGVKHLTFANADGSLSYGGEFEGSVRQSNCIPDYYSKKPSNATDITSGGLAQAISAGSGSYSATAPAGGSINLTGSATSLTIPAGDQITVYVKGNAYLNASILYDSASTVSSVPKFALIVSGSLYIDKGVHELDGMYVAEPAGNTSVTVSSDDGIIWTCHNSATGQEKFTYPPFCTSSLVVNGALIAKQVNFERVPGDIGSSSTNDDSLNTVSTCASGSCNVSEVANYTPAMIMGGGFFNPSSGGNNSGLPIDSVVSLPPVF